MRDTMTRETTIAHKIALLATGDEIVHGDIINSNSQEIALRLVNNGMQVGTHMTVPDNTAEIEQAIHFLLSTHQALIITGGLGPTSDDLTRYALSNVLNHPLKFDTPTWEMLCARLKRFGYPTPPESNRQQALFPEGVTIIANLNGTAAGCMMQMNKQFIFMLPGPPIECLPMVDAVVLPTLKQANFQHVLYHKKWLLFGVSEGKIAEELDALAKPYDCVTGYRLWYPYIEFKLHSSNQNDFNTLVPLIEKLLAPYLIGDGQQSASDMLQKKLPTLNFTLGITDQATGGSLEARIRTPQTKANLNFLADKPHVQIKGLENFWEGKNDSTKANLEIIFSNKKSIKTEIQFRGKHIKKYAVEFICWKILDFLTDETG